MLILLPEVIICSVSSVKEYPVKSGEITIPEARFLGHLAADLSVPGAIVEVGCLYGWSTRVLALFKEPDRQLIAIDNFSWNPMGFPASEHFRWTTYALESACRENCTILKMDKNAYYALAEESRMVIPPALVFLDAEHSYIETRKDIAWAKRVKAHLICLHDYCPEAPGVVQAVDEAGGVESQVGSLVVLKQ